MNPAAISACSPNPFAASRLRPGTIPFIFASHRAERELRERLAASHGWGQIIGPHGTGKSTLAVQIVGEMQDHGTQVRYVRLSSETARWPWSWRELMRSRSGTQYVIDGFEQLAAWQKHLIRGMLRWRGCPLIVTAHSDQGLATLLETGCDLRVAQAVVNRLLQRSNQRTVVPMEVLAEKLDTHDGNLRESLFDLYDWFQSSGCADSMIATTRKIRR